MNEVQKNSNAGNRQKSHGTYWKQQNDRNYSLSVIKWKLNPPFKRHNKDTTELYSVYNKVCTWDPSKH